MTTTYKIIISDLYGQSVIFTTKDRNRVFEEALKIKGPRPLYKSYDRERVKITREDS